ncbi:MAG: DUF1508 domain-containing protein [Candidatus Binatia bacterium]
MFKQFEELQNSVHAIFGTEMPDVITIPPDRHKAILKELGLKWQHEDPDGTYFYIGQSKVRPGDSKITFELFSDARGKWRFHLLSANAKIIMSSEPYHTRANARRAARRAREIMASCPDLENEEETDQPAKPRIGLFKDTSKKWRMHIIGGNGQIILSSEAYSSKTRAFQTAFKLPEWSLQASITVKEEE